MKNDAVKSIVVLGSICLAVALLLSSVNMITSPLIAEAELKAADEAFYEVLPDATEFETVQLEAGVPGSVVEMRKDKGGSGYALKLTASSSFSQSPLSFVIGIGSDGLITEISFINYAETKGSAEEFKAIFEGKDSSAADVLAGATYSTAAIKGAIADAYTVLAQYGGIEQSDEQKLAAVYDKLMPNAKDATGAYKFEAVEAELGSADGIEFTAAYTPSNKIGYIITANVSDVAVAVGINAFGKAYAVYDLDGNDLTDDAAYSELKSKAEALLEPIYRSDEKRNLRSLGTMISETASAESVCLENVTSTVVGAFKITDKGSESYALIAQPIGYGGTIKLCYILGQDGDIVAFKVMSHNESEYYGDKIGKSEYSDRQTGNISELGEQDMLVTGATVTSNAMKLALNDIKAAFDTVKEGF